MAPLRKQEFFCCVFLCVWGFLQVEPVVFLNNKWLGGKKIMAGWHLYLHTVLLNYFSSLHTSTFKGKAKETLESHWIYNTKFKRFWLENRRENSHQTDSVTSVPQQSLSEVSLHQPPSSQGRKRRRNELLSDLKWEKELIIVSKCSSHFSRVLCFLTCRRCHDTMSGQRIKQSRVTVGRTFGRHVGLNVQIKF